MKKYIILAAAAVMALAACSKVDNIGNEKEITFEVANRLQTKANTVYSNGAFGTYAWFTAVSGTTPAVSGSDHAPFMINETVDKVSGVWKTTQNTFYWPKTGSIDFISYSPFDAASTNGTANSNPAITQNSISYSSITAGSVDYMYADKATCSSNVDLVNDGVDSGFSGVPTIFRHALAKLSFKIKAPFVEYTDPTTNTKTEWEITVTSAKISGFKTTGSCALTLNATDNKTWDKPVTQVANPDYDATDPNSVEYFEYNVWTNLSGSTAAQELVDATTFPDGIVLTTDAQDLNPANGFVIPQVLSADAQKLELVVKIKTTLSNGLEIEENFNPVLDIKDLSTLKAWEMNQNIVYTINLKPVLYVSDWDTPNDVVIRFDPAVADWDNVDASATINL